MGWKQSHLLLVSLMAVALAGCAAAEPPAATTGITLPPQDQPTARLADTPSAPTPVPTQAAREMRLYEHRSGVFDLSLPAGWLPVDQSNGTRLLVAFVPPAGYGSRVTVDVTNEGPLAPDAVQMLAGSYIHLNFESSPAYTEISRTDLSDGRLQVVYLYEDGLGAAGRETLVVRQVGPYFTALRIFLSETDTYLLSDALDAIAASFLVDPLAIWGSEAAAVEPAALQLRGTSLWRDADGLTYFMGEVVNSSGRDLVDVQVRVALCDEAGIVLADVTQPAALTRVAAEGSSPFAAALPDLPEELSVCGQGVTAAPAEPDPRYTSTLLLDASAGYDTSRRLVIRGSVTNPGLASVTEVEIFLLVYDATDRLVGFQPAEYDPDLVLAPGASDVFEHTFPELGGTAERFVALAQARVISARSPSLLPGG
jgi:hypothetical protein